jgi:hypothetical protein
VRTFFLQYEKCLSGQKSRIFDRGSNQRTWTVSNFAPIMLSFITREGGPGCELVPGEPVRARVWLAGQHCGPPPGFDDLPRHGQATKDVPIETFVPQSTNQARAKRVLTGLADAM